VCARRFTAYAQQSRPSPASSAHSTDDASNTVASLDAALARCARRVASPCARDRDARG
jgi:hypothetical protein